MATQASTPPTDNERLSRLEGEVGQISLRLTDMQSQINNLRVLMFGGFGIIWATMVTGFIAVFIAISNI